ncbi:hypothetical protein Pelo_2869 [Pelomyxa schiedti]|nr:hypothetical protein Pelo_2869 [Pelomyxa schiedti]
MASVSRSCCASGVIEQVVWGVVTPKYFQLDPDAEDCVFWRFIAHNSDIHRRLFAKLKKWKESSEFQYYRALCIIAEVWPELTAKCGQYLVEVLQDPCAVLCVASSCGSLRLARWIVRSLQLCTSTNHVPFLLAPTAVVPDSHYNWGVVCSKLLKDRVLQLCCQGGHLLFAMWAKVSFALSIDNARSGMCACLRWCCAGGHLPTAKWLAAAFKLTGDDLSCCDWDALIGACEGGYLYLCKWLAANAGCVGMPTPSLRGRLNRASLTSSNDQLVSWVSSLFHVPYLEPEELQLVAMHNNPEFVQSYLHEHPLPHLLQQNIIYAVVGACASGNLGVVRALLTSSLNEVFVNNKALLAACSSGNVQVVRYVIDVCAEGFSHWALQDSLLRASHTGNTEIIELILSLRHDSVVTLANLKCCAAIGNLPSLQWLINRFSVTDKDILQSIQLEACKSGNGNIVRWINMQFRVPEKGSEHATELFNSCFAMSAEDIEWAIDNLLAPTSPSFTQNISQLLTDCINQGNLKAAKYLASRGGVIIINSRNLKIHLSSDTLPTWKWAAKKFGTPSFSPEEVRSIVRVCLSRSCTEGAIWVLSTFGAQSLSLPPQPELFWYLISDYSTRSLSGLQAFIQIYGDLPAIDASQEAKSKSAVLKILETLVIMDDRLEAAQWVVSHFQLKNWLLTRSTEPPFSGDKPINHLIQRAAQQGALETTLWLLQIAGTKVVPAEMPVSAWINNHLAGKERLPLIAWLSM